MNSRIKPVFKCPDLFKEKFKHSRCLITISVGQEVHEGEKFAATIELINSSFQSCIMLIDDSLQRHTMAIEKEEDADFFYSHSIQEGDTWLERNKKTYSKLDSLEKILRWNDWLNHPNYSETQNNIISLQQSNINYKTSFDSTIEEFIRRYYSRINNVESKNIQRTKQLCMNYLIEECTAMCLWPELNCQFEVYPSPRNSAMSKTHELFVLPKYPQLLHSVAIKFKNRKQLLPQQFKVLTNEGIIA
jgi:hypothetical protein